MIINCLLRIKNYSIIIYFKLSKFSKYITPPYLALFKINIFLDKTIEEFKFYLI
jgi:hypothetical protein